MITSTLSTPTTTCTIHTAYPERIKRPLQLAEPAHQRAQKGSVQLLKSAFEQAISIKNKRCSSEDEDAALTHEINLQKHNIKLLEMAHQEKWTAHIEGVNARMCALASEISKIITSIEIFQAKHPGALEPASKDPKHDSMLKSLGSDVFGQTIGALACHSISLPYFQDWLFSVTGPPVYKSDEKHPKCEAPKTYAQSVETVNNPEKTPQVVLSPIVIAAQKMFALEKDIANKKQELTMLKQLQVLRKEEHQVFMRSWSFFEPCLEHANLLEEMMNAHIAETTSLILESEQKSSPQYAMRGPGSVMYKMRNGLIEEAVRLKGTIRAITLEIEKAIDWENDQSLAMPTLPITIEQVFGAYKSHKQ